MGGDLGNRRGHRGIKLTNGVCPQSWSAADSERLVWGGPSWLDRALLLLRACPQSDELRDISSAALGRVYSSTDLP